MVRGALDLAKITTEDAHAGMPEEFGRLTEDLRLYDDAIANLETASKIDSATRAEKAALSADPRIQNSEGASFDSYIGVRVFANSRGFVSSYRTSSCGMSVVPVAKQNGSMERDYWHSAGRHLATLEAPEAIGARAAERALRRLNPRKVATQKVPVVFEPRTARSLLGDLLDAVCGTAIYRHASFLTGQAGREDRLGHADGGRRCHYAGTVWHAVRFDDEGVASRRTMVIERGVLKSYLLNSYCARKLNLKTTGNASRGVTGNAGIGPGNFYIEAGDLTEAADSCPGPQRPVCDRTDRRVHQHGHGRLFQRRVRAVDRKWRTRLSGFGDHHRGKSEADAEADPARRLQPGVPRLGRLAYAHD